MRKIRILTDSASDIPKAAARELGIRVLPIPILHEGKVYSERVEFTDEEFYDLLHHSKTIPTTSHIVMYTYLAEYKKALEEGCTQLLNVTINSLGSSIYSAACLAKQVFYEELGEKASGMRIEVVDSKTYTIAYGIAVMAAARMAMQGRDLDGILEYLNDWFDRLELLFSVYSLDFVKKSGRVSCAAAFVGELLGLRPIIVFINGAAAVIDRVRGNRNVVDKLVATAKKRAEDPQNYPVVIACGTPVKEGGELAEKIAAAFGLDGVEVYSVGASIAINSGPDVVAVVYAGRKRENNSYILNTIKKNSLEN